MRQEKLLRTENLWQLSGMENKTVKHLSNRVTTLLKAGLSQMNILANQYL